MLNINKVILYYFIIIIINWYSLISNLEIITFNLFDNSESLLLPEIKETELDSNIPLVPISKYDKFRRWIYWKTFGVYHGKYNNYTDCKLKLNPKNISLRSEVKAEITSFKKSPLNYIKKEREFFKMRGKADMNKFINTYNNKFR